MVGRRQRTRTRLGGSATRPLWTLPPPLLAVFLAGVLVALAVPVTARDGAAAAVASDLHAVRETPAGTVSWQSAGDSYSSGEGVFRNEGACAQSDLAYGPQTAQRLHQRGWRMSSTTFTACTGHLVEDVFNERPDSGKDGVTKKSLWDWGREQGGPSRVDVLTMSFGGNDIGFADLIRDCVVVKPDHWNDYLIGGVAGSFTGCDTSEAEINARIDALLDPPRRNCSGSRRLGEAGYDCDLDLGARRGSLIDFYYDLVTQRLTDRGQLYVVGYPRLFAPTDQWPAWAAAMCSGVKRGDTERMGREGMYLNAKLNEAVDRVNQALGEKRVHFVDRLALYASGQHELCGKGADWLNGISTDRGDGSIRIETSFHPNAAGHDGVATALVDMVDSTLPSVAPNRPPKLSKSGPGEHSLSFTHPGWGRVTLITHENSDDERTPGPASIRVVDADGNERWRYDNTFQYTMRPVGASSDDPRNPIDAAGNIYIDFNPGRYNGVIVLRPTQSGFADFETLPPPPDGYNTRFYSGVAKDVDGDGTYEIQVGTNNCDPSCGEGTTTVTTWKWDGKDFVAQRPDQNNQITIDGFGPLRLGMTLREIGDLGLEVSGPGCGTHRSINRGAGNVSVTLGSGDEVLALSTTDAAWVTPSGIHAGSSVAELRAAYGDNLSLESFDGNVGQAQAWVLRSPQANAAGRFLWFVTAGDKVRSIDLLSRGSTSTMTLC